MNTPADILSVMKQPAGTTPAGFTDYEKHVWESCAATFNLNHGLSRMMLYQVCRIAERINTCIDAIDKREKEMGVDAYFLVADGERQRHGLVDIILMSIDTLDGYLDLFLGPVPCLDPLFKRAQEIKKIVEQEERGIVSSSIH